MSAKLFWANAFAPLAALRETFCCDPARREAKDCSLQNAMTAKLFGQMLCALALRETFCCDWARRDAEDRSRQNAMTAMTAKPLGQVLRALSGSA